jgi:succinate dehydrogenase (ubiquinone) cytochrome b560 subunit
MILAAPLYIFGAAYLVSPLMGWHLDSAGMVEWFGGLSDGSRMAVRGVFTYPFVFHSFHGIRHLIWDTGAMLTNRQQIVSGWLTVAGSVMVTIALMCL